MSDKDKEREKLNEAVRWVVDTLLKRIDTLEDVTTKFIAWSERELGRDAAIELLNELNASREIPESWRTTNEVRE